MARNYTTQHLFYENGYAIDCGYVAFSTTGATVEIYTPLSKIYTHSFGIVASSAGTCPSNDSEILWLDEVPGGDGAVAVSAGSVTLARKGREVIMAFALDNGQIASYNYSETGLFVAPEALTLEKAIFLLGTAFGGVSTAATLQIGTQDGSPANNLAAGTITNTANTATTFTSFDSTAIAAGAAIAMTTTGGTTSGPGDCSLTLVMRKAVASGLKVFYRFVGLG
jgi:hypothetical protein